MLKIGSYFIINSFIFHITEKGVFCEKKKR
jgi:hypothetical protein